MAPGSAGRQPKLAALFVAVFDDVKGQSISWSRSITGLDLSQLEFAALPSGLHLVDEDIFSFSHRGLPGLAAFKNHELNEEELKEANRVSGGRSRGRRMRSIGVVFSDPAAHGDGYALTETLEQLHVSLEAAEGGLKLIEDDSDSYGDLDRLWLELRSERGVAGSSSKSALDFGTSVQVPHPLLYLPTLFQICGPSFMTLWKYSLGGKRILFYSQPSLHPVSQAAWCTWAIGVPPRSASTSQPHRYLGNVGLMHMDELKKVDLGGWVATTSDAIYKTRPDMWDLFVDFSDTKLPSVQTAEAAILSTLEETPRTDTPPPVISASYLAAEGKLATKTLSYTFSDIPLYRSLAAVIASPDSAMSGGLSTAFWTTAYTVFGALYGFCIGVCEFALGRAYTANAPVRLGDSEEHDRLLDLSDADDTETKGGPQVIHHLSHHTHHLHARLKLLIAQKGPRQLTSREMSSLGLSAWSELDREFVQSLIRDWELE